MKDQKFDIYGFTDADLDNIISELQDLRQGKRKYAGFTAEVGSVLIVNEETYSLLKQEDFTPLSEVEAEVTEFTYDAD